MKITFLTLVGLLFLTTPLALAAPEDMVVTSYGYEGCDHTVSTNHFDLAAGEVAFMSLDFSQCRPEDLRGLLYFGYNTTRNSSRPITLKDKVELRILDPVTGEEINYEDFDGIGGGNFAFIQLATGGPMLFSATNVNRGKPRRVRLRVSSGL